MLPASDRLAAVQRRGKLSNNLGGSGAYACWRKSRSFELGRRWLCRQAAYLALSRRDSRTKSLILRILILPASSYPCGFAARRWEDGTSAASAALTPETHDA